MSAQAYLSRLVHEGRTDSVHARAALRTGQPTRPKRLRRALEHRSH